MVYIRVANALWTILNHTMFWKHYLEILHKVWISSLMGKLKDQTLFVPHSKMKIITQRWIAETLFNPSEFPPLLWSPNTWPSLVCFCHYSICWSLQPREFSIHNVRKTLLSFQECSQYATIGSTWIYIMKFQQGNVFMDTTAMKLERTSYLNICQSMAPRNIWKTFAEASVLKVWGSLRIGQGIYILKFPGWSLCILNFEHNCPNKASN